MSSDVIDRIFFDQDQAGKMLGHCASWMRVKAKEHDLFKPSVGKAQQGKRSLYHREHIGIISEHLVNPDEFDMDSALRAWQRWKRIKRNDRTAPDKQRKRRAPPMDTVSP